MTDRRTGEATSELHYGCVNCGKPIASTGLCEPCGIADTTGHYRGIEKAVELIERAAKAWDSLDRTKAETLRRFSSVYMSPEQRRERAIPSAGVSMCECDYPGETHDESCPCYVATAPNAGHAESPMPLDEVQAVIDFERKAERARTIEDCARIVEKQGHLTLIERNVRDSVARQLRMLASRSQSPKSGGSPAPAQSADSSTSTTATPRPSADPRLAEEIDRKNDWKRHVLGEPQAAAPSSRATTAVSITYFKTSGKYYTTDENVYWPEDKSHYTGWAPFRRLHRIKGMIAVCMEENPLGFPQLSPPFPEALDDAVEPFTSDESKR